jgi:hypothetical protein
MDGIREEFESHPIEFDSLLKSVENPIQSYFLSNNET